MLVLGLTLLANSASAQNKGRVQVEDELCRYTAFFDPARDKGDVVRASFEFASRGYGAPTFAPPLFSPQQAAKADPQAVQKECDKRIAELKSMRLVDLPAMEALRANSIAEAEDACRLDVIEVRGAKNPAALRDYTPAREACEHYVAALEGKNELQKAYRQWSEKSCANNASPTKCKADEQSREKDPELMRTRLMAFGWGNCANDKSLRARDVANGLAEKAQAEFRKAYRLKKGQCDEP
jgi:hypothetical protein